MADQKTIDMASQYQARLGSLRQLMQKLSETDYKERSALIRQADHLAVIIIHLYSSYFTNGQLKKLFVSPSPRFSLNTKIVYYRVVQAFLVV